MTHFHTNGVLFSDVFGTQEMRKVFSEERFIERFLEVEAALARAQAEVGIIPAPAAEEITNTASLELLDMDEVAENVTDMHLFSVSIIDAWKRLMGDAGEYVHWGATTQDISDTALVLQMREGLDIVKRDLVAIVAALEDLTERHADTPTMGRTHSVHALPMTFGLRTATWLDEINRQRKRIAEIRDRVEVLEFFGAVGTLASLGDDGLAVQEALAEELDLAVPNVAWFATRDRVAETVTTLAMVSATLARISDQILLQNREEFDELAEPFEAGEVGSSTMPHKRNPVRTEETVMLNRLTRAHAGTALELMVGYDERDFATALAEFAVVPETFLYTSRALKYTHEVLEGLVVDEAAMRHNLGHHGDLVAGEAVMMALAEELGRQTAHDVTHEAAMAALDGEQSYAEALLLDDRVSSVFSSAELEDLLNPESYTGLSAELAQRALKSSRARD